MRLISAICVLIFCTIQPIICANTTVQVQEGLLQGELKTTISGNVTYYSFKGIPYAKPPTGSLRFKAPEPPVPWTGIRNATEHGNVCPQYEVLTDVYNYGSEDCLFLNVYSPDLNPDSLLPVMVYIHGGAFIFGSGNDDYYSPDYLIGQGILLVTFNYRLDALGFLGLDTEEIRGNSGLKDQVQALKWVQNNIKMFGGDSSNVTVFGGSAGGASIMYHLVSPMSKGLFKRAIAMSGAPTCDCVYHYQPRRRAIKLAQTLGCDSQNITEIQLFLQNVTYEKLVYTAPKILAAEEEINVLFKLEYFSPVIEKDFKDNKSFILDDPLKIASCGNVNDVDVMFSYNSQEALIMIDLCNSSYIDRYNKFREMFVPSELYIISPPDTNLAMSDKIVKFHFGNESVSVDNIDTFMGFASNASISYHVQRFANCWRHVGSKYFFKFSSYSSLNYYGQQGAPFSITGAAHMDDMFYMFYSTKLKLLPANNTEYKMMQNLIAAVTNFAKYGNPSPNSSLGVTWPEYDNETMAYADFGTDVTIKYAPDNAVFSFWKSLYKFAGKPFYDYTC